MSWRAPKLRWKIPKLTVKSIAGGIFKGAFQSVWFLGWLSVKTVQVVTIGVVIGTVKAGKVGYKYGVPAAVRVGKWTAKQSRAATAAAAHKAAAGLADHPRIAGWAQRFGDRIAPTTKATSPTAVDAANPPRDAAPATERRPRRAPTRQAVSPRTHSTPSTAPTSSPSGSSNQSASPSASRSGGVRMQEFQKVIQAAQPLADMDPGNAWELDEQFAAFASMWPKMAEIFASYGEHLDRDLKLDPRVVQVFYAATGSVSELFREFQGVRGLFRVLYADAFAQAESNVRDISKEKFWDKASAA